MNQIFDILVWVASGLILLFVFLVIVNRSMQNMADKREDEARKEFKDS